MALLKRMLPKPPSPPLAIVMTSPGVSSSYSTSPVSASVMMVPTGILQRDVVAGGAEHVRAHAVLAALGFVAAREAEVDQRVEVRVGHREHMAAAAAVAAVGAAEFLVLLVPERHAAVAAVAGGDVDEGFVDELHG